MRKVIIIDDEPLKKYGERIPATSAVGIGAGMQ
jgi:hypothetical protein